MNKFFQFDTLALFLSSANLYAHHPAADIVDEEIYEMKEKGEYKLPFKFK